MLVRISAILHMKVTTDNLSSYQSNLLASQKVFASSVLERGGTRERTLASAFEGKTLSKVEGSSDKEEKQKSLRGQHVKATGKRKAKGTTHTVQRFRGLNLLDVSHFFLLIMDSDFYLGPALLLHTCGLP
ncbi:DNA-directed RNA polymerase subunit beta' [Striga asiatica]|uniref:DNA-directed RNA polymerase subunit beta n=1 Tax=Striga asiatica TaxID=4170 RepID=A0A5A7R542_STRAF|nr:DNA-directed RNA polymerase subunit beta' [Striga asiatica]